jgi:outer membrane immunogenic protein
MNRSLVIGTTLLGLASAPAFAADIAPRMVTKAPMMVSGYNWSGCYIGANGGGKWASTRGDVAVGAVPGSPAVGVTFDRVNADTGIFGGQIGCNWQAPGSNWVFGVEGDADWQRWSTTRTLAATLPPLVAGDTFDIRSRWQGSARGKIGYAWDRWMIYATGGAAFTNVKVGANFPIFVGAVVFPASSAEDSKTLLGATVGGGLEYAFTNNWSAGIEGRYSFYGSQTFNGGTVAAVPVVGAAVTFLNAPVTQTVRLDTFEVTGRLNYKFDFGGPVVARY